MIAAGFVRKVDELGRVVLPIELRKHLFLEVKDPIEFFVDGDCIILKKYQQGDVFTGETDELVEYKGKKVSKKNILELYSLLQEQESKN